MIPWGLSPRRVLSNQDGYAYLKNLLVPDQIYAHITTQTLTKGKKDTTHT